MKGVVITTCLVAFSSLTFAAPKPTYLRKEWSLESLANPEELGGYFEGDIELPLPPLEKNGVINEKYHWPGGRVAYDFDSNFSEANKDVVRLAVEEYKERTNGCIVFHERKHEDDYIRFSNDNSDGCHSKVGRRGGKQGINYTQHCLDKFGSVMHEMLHALGFHHEQSRPDRDDYVEIMWENIEAGHEHNFKKYSSSEVSGYGENYDYSSVMHYSAHAFSDNGKKTIVPKDPNATIGQRVDISQIDLNKLMKMYKC